MGVKSTIYVTRAEAEQRYLESAREVARIERRRKIEAKINGLGSISLPYPLCEKGLSDRDVLDIFLHVDWLRRIDKVDAESKDLLTNVDDDTLERELEAVHDIAKGGEGFENYIIGTNTHGT